MEQKPIDSGFISFENGIITGLGSMSGLLPEDADTIDAKGSMLLPGFVDAHAHLGMWEDSLGFEGDDGNEDTEPSTPHLRAIDAVNPLDKCFEEARRAGITAVATGPGSANPIGGQIAVLKTGVGCLEDMLIRQPAAIKMALGENPKTVYRGKSMSPSTRMATAAIIREQLYKAVRYISDNENAASGEADYPEYDMKCEALIPLLHGELTAHIHAHRADDIETAIRLSKEFGLKISVIHATSGHKIANALAKENVSVLLGPLMCDRSKPELRDLTPRCAGVLCDAGVRLALISDHPEFPVQYLPISAGLAVREGMDYYKALKALTINPAEILGVDDKIGSLKVGKHADMAIFKADPLSIQGRPWMVFIDGVQIL